MNRCYVSEQIANHCNEPEPEYCLKDGGELTQTGHLEHRIDVAELECDDCGQVHWYDLEDGLELAE